MLRGVRLPATAKQLLLSCKTRCALKFQLDLGVIIRCQYNKHLKNYLWGKKCEFEINFNLTIMYNYWQPRTIWAS